MIEQSAYLKQGLKLRYGMAEPTAGCFTRSAENTLATGKALGVAHQRLIENV